MRKTRGGIFASPWNARKTALMIAGAYGLIVAARYVLALITSAHPVTMIDEFLYYSLARSIASGEGLLYRGQSAEYAYLLYPLILSPMYLIFGEGARMYRILQLWNILLMSLSLIPIYALANVLIKNAKKAFAAALGVMLLPDFIFGGVFGSEAILYPLFFSLLFFGYRYLQNQRLGDILAVGAIGGLMFSAKPGQIIPAAVFIAACLYFAARERNAKSARAALCGAGTALIVMGAFFALAVFGFGYRGSLLSVYDTQMTLNQNGLHLDAFCKALAFYPYYFILSCGVLGFLLPVGLFRRYDAHNRRFFTICLLSLAVMMLGTAWAVNRNEFNILTVHMRYIAMYVPVMFLMGLSPVADGNRACLLPRAALPKKRFSSMGLPPAIWAILAYTLLMTLLFGCGAGTQTDSAIFSNMTLALLRDEYLSDARQWIGVILIFFLSGFTVLLVKKRSLSRARSACATVMIVLMLANGVAAYTKQRSLTFFPLPDESQAVMDRVGDTDFLFVSANDTIISHGNLDCGLKRNTCIVTIADLFDRVYASKGVYEPFLPQWTRGMLPNPDRLTPDTDTLVVDYAVYAMLSLAPGVKHTSTDSGTLHTITFSKGERFVDSMIGNINVRALTVGERGILVIFNPDMLASPLTVRLEIGCAQNTALAVFSNVERRETEITAGRGFYEFTFDRPQAAYNFTCPNDISVFGYELVNP